MTPLPPSLTPLTPTDEEQAALARIDAAAALRSMQRQRDLDASAARALAWTEHYVAQHAERAARTAPIGGWTALGDTMASGPMVRRVTSTPQALPPSAPAPMPSSTNSGSAMQYIADPEQPQVCTCGGDGWYKLTVSVSDPRFGRLFPCRCVLEQRAAQQASALAALDKQLGRSVHATLRSCLTFAQQRELHPLTWDGRRWSEAEQRASLIAAITDAALVVKAACTDGDAPIAPWRWYVGPFGSGKTHIAAAIANAIRQDAAVRRRLTVPIAVTHMRRLISYLSSCFDREDRRDAKDRRTDRRFDRAIESLVAVPMLVLDGLGEEWRRSEADRTGEATFFIDAILDVLVARYNQARPPLTIITSNHRIAACVPPRQADRFAEVAPEVVVAAWSARQVNAARIADAWDRGEGEH